MQNYSYSSPGERAEDGRYSRDVQIAADIHTIRNVALFFAWIYGLALLGAVMLWLLR